MCAIVLQDVNKYYYLQHQKTLKEVLQAFILQKKTIDSIHAVKNLSFSIKRGEVVGIIGKNGAGKSTLLKLIAGVSKPSSGTVQLNGRLAPLIELGAGFHPELSGRENIYLNGIILGLTEQEVTERFDDIVAFAEIRDFIDMPVKNYSSGMYVRLAFSVAVATQPEILLVDEVLSVGDLSFQKKCMQRMESFRKNGTTIVLVSHDLGTVESFCERTIIIDHGLKVFDGNAREGVSLFRERFL
ncbi:MAG: ABC transporter ATP-binding protein [Patescibacteria group bacterium]|nr:ABC transporter ATP-binding protein [Patescibacteria group bacterium]